MVDEVLAKMEKLAVLYLSGNEVTKKVKNYRKTLIIKLKNLKYLDDRPVFPEERRFCEAFDRGGIDAEREERKLYKKEQEEAHLRNHYAFRDMIEKYRKEAEAEKQ
jgi:dynein assembly factor 1